MLFRGSRVVSFLVLIAFLPASPARADGGAIPSVYLVSEEDADGEFKWADLQAAVDALCTRVKETSDADWGEVVIRRAAAVHVDTVRASCSVRFQKGRDGAGQLVSTGGSLTLQSQESISVSGLELSAPIGIVITGKGDVSVSESRLLSSAMIRSDGPGGVRLRFNETGTLRILVKGRPAPERRVEIVSNEALSAAGVMLETHAAYAGGVRIAENRGYSVLEVKALEETGRRPGDSPEEEGTAVLALEKNDWLGAEGVRIRDWPGAFVMNESRVEGCLRLGRLLGHGDLNDVEVITRDETCASLEISGVPEVRVTASRFEAGRSEAILVGASTLKMQGGAVSGAVRLQGEGAQARITEVAFSESARIRDLNPRGGLLNDPVRDCSGLSPERVESRRDFDGNGCPDYPPAADVCESR